MISVRRVLVALTLAIGFLPALSSAASAHPLGNFTVNHLSIVTVQADAVHVRYILDLAEIPTLQETNAGSVPTIVERTAAALSLHVDGSFVPLRVERSASERLTGQAGLDTLRVTIELSGATTIRDGLRIDYRDLSFPGRIGWHDVVLRGAVTQPTVGPDEPTNELRSYPADATVAPPDRLAAQATVRTGANIDGSAAAATRAATSRDPSAGGGRTRSAALTAATSTCRSIRSISGPDTFAW